MKFYYYIFISTFRIIYMNKQKVTRQDLSILSIKISKLAAVVYELQNILDLDVNDDEEFDEIIQYIDTYEKYMYAVSLLQDEIGRLEVILPKVNFNIQEEYIQILGDTILEYDLDDILTLMNVG